MIEENQGLSGRLGAKDAPIALAPPSGVEPASSLQQSRSSTDAGSLRLLRSIVEGDISRDGRTCSTMIRAGLMLDILDEIERLSSLAKANNQLARMNGEHRDMWRARAVDCMEALDEMLQRDRRRYEQTPEAEAHYLRNNAQALAALASVDTHPKDGDALVAPLVSGAVGEAETPKVSL